MADLALIERSIPRLSESALYHRSGRPFNIDPCTYSLVTITYPHKEIHGGSSYAVNMINTTSNSDDHRSLIGFSTPDTDEIMHLVATVFASTAAEAFLYEGVTIDDDEGTEKAVLNRNRNSDKTSAVLSLENPAVAGLVTWMLEAEVAAANFSFVTEIDHKYLVAGDGPKALGGTHRGDQEWMLKRDTKYAVVIQNVGASINNHQAHLDWYAHIDKD